MEILIIAALLLLVYVAYKKTNSAKVVTKVVETAETTASAVVDKVEVATEEVVTVAEVAVKTTKSVAKKAAKKAEIAVEEVAKDVEAPVKKPRAPRKPKLNVAKYNKCKTKSVSITSVTSFYRPMRASTGKTRQLAFIV